MPARGDLENFIPFRRSELVEFCAGEGRLEGAQADRLRALARLVFALYHHEFHQRIERIKDAFAPFDPDADVTLIEAIDGTAREARIKQLFTELEEVLVRANYEQISQADLERALVARSLIAFELKVDFADFDDMLMYKRGARTRTVPLRKGPPLLRKTVDHQVESFERVVLLLRYKAADYFEAQGRKREKLPFQPGRLYIQLFKDVPRADLEVLFPNVKVGMTTRDKAVFLVPLLGAGVPVALKVAVSITGLATALAIFFGIRDGGDAAALAGATAGLTGLAALGGFLFKQYAKYTSTMTRFLKGMTEQLFFKNIDSNAGVFRTLVDEAEEEEGKEALLAYYHLLVGGPCGEAELDRTIEAWFQERFGATLDFEVDDALRKLVALDLIEVDDGEVYRARDLDAALRICDETWDNLYRFA